MVRRRCQDTRYHRRIIGAGDGDGLGLGDSAAVAVADGIGHHDAAALADGQRIERGVAGIDREGAAAEAEACRGGAAGGAAVQCIGDAGRHAERVAIVGIAGAGEQV